MMFENKHPVCLFWGPDQTYFYNDSFIPIVGSFKHPHVMGKMGKDVWAEVWDVVFPLISSVMNGEGAVWNEDHLLHVVGDGGILREAYFTYSYSPIYQEDGRVAGVLVTCTETTDRVNAQKKLTESQARFKQAAEGTRGSAYQNLIRKKYSSVLRGR